MTAPKACFVLLLGAMVVAGPAYGQGRSEAAPGKNKDAKSPPANSGSATRSSNSGIASPVTATTPTSAPASSANSIIYYGSWLDDASIVEPGDVWVGLSTGYWTADNNRQFDVPVMSAAVGVNRWMQAGGSASFYHFRDADGLSEAGAGSLSLYGKFLLVDPSRKRDAIGLAITPLLELSPGGQDQIGWALPVNIEKRRGNARVYGSAGYFSRGSVFATVAADVPASSRVSISANLGQSYARAGTHQTSLGAGAFVMLTSTSGVFVGLGHTLMPAEVGPGGLSLAGGVSFLLPQPKQP